MLAILGLFGVVMAGLAADALISGQGDEADDSQDVPPEDDGPVSDGNLLDDLDVPRAVAVARAEGGDAARGLLQVLALG